MNAEKRDASPMGDEPRRRYSFLLTKIFFYGCLFYTTDPADGERTESFIIVEQVMGQAIAFPALNDANSSSFLTGK